MKPADSSRRSTQPNQAPRPSRYAPRDVAVLIPAYQPTGALEPLIMRLIECGVPAILLVDDGTPAPDRAVFERLAHQPRVHLIHHANNKGKGIALKTGIRYFLDHFQHYKGLVTASAAAEHPVEDILRVARALHKSPRLAITGARSFGLTLGTGSFRGIPLRNLFANRLTAAIFRLVTSIPLTDAQTGLRALPTTLLPDLLEIPGTRYEYEMSMLLYIARSRHPLAEQPIRTHYDPAIATSHFRPIADSLRVLRALLERRTYVARKFDSSFPAESTADLSRTNSTRTVRTKF
jgi:glycosyltransferase involved in cell wall biosynthesis